MSPHCIAVFCIAVVLQMPLHDVLPAGQPPTGTPASAEPAAKTSGYEATSALVMQAPDDAPALKMRVGSAFLFWMTYFTMLAMAALAPLRPGLASKQFVPALGEMMMKPYWSARDWNQEWVPPALPPQ